MGMTPTERADWKGHPTADGPLPAFIDWILGAIIALAGLLSIVAESALVFLADRNALAEGIEDGTVSATLGALGGYLGGKFAESRAAIG